MILQPPTSDFSAFEIGDALMRGAAGDHGAESGVLLLMAFGDWFPQLSQADLITVDICLDGCCGVDPVATMNWAGVDPALADGRLVGSSRDTAVLRVAASLAHGRPMDLGELAAGLDRRSIGPVQAAIAFATYDPEVRRAIVSGP